MLKESDNPYEGHVDQVQGPSARRTATPRIPARAGSVALVSKYGAPTTPAEVRTFDFAAALVKNDSAWRELARAIATEAA